MVQKKEIRILRAMDCVKLDTRAKLERETNNRKNVLRDSIVYLEHHCWENLDPSLALLDPSALKDLRNQLVALMGFIALHRADLDKPFPHRLHRHLHLNHPLHQNLVPYN